MSVRPKIKYIGRKIDFRGNTLWEIVANLKNFGVGRIVTRSMFERYPEPCFMKILKVQAVPSPPASMPHESRKVKVLVEKTFRGVTYPKPVEIFSVSYKADYRLIPKDEEAEYCKITKKNEMRILPRYIDYPPLFREYIKDETGEENPMMEFRFKPTRDKQARLAKEGEQPNVEVKMAIDDKISASLRRNFKF